ncbi:MAG TPA: hypothetical protein VEJ84_02570, partial [Acidimicrobiales bacterium]|nr:hypothetical protein [Acidimicrobiales bacterium]
MTLPSPNLDDRTWDQLRRQALEQVAKRCSDWTDLSPTDPGVTLLEVFAYLTEALAYRLNRLPEKAYVEFLNLIGVTQLPPSAAVVDVTLSIPAARSADLVIPAGTRVTLQGRASDAPIFTIVKDAVILKNGTSTSARAFQAELVTEEAVGPGTGLPGQQFSVRRPPIVAAVNDDRAAADLALHVFVEATPQELLGRPPAEDINGKAYRQWREVGAFVDLGADRACYRADRLAGTISFAPALRQLTGDSG